MERRDQHILNPDYESLNGLLPIPESSIKSNPNLTQEYGY